MHLFFWALDHHFGLRIILCSLPIQYMYKNDETVVQIMRRNVTQVQVPRYTSTNDEYRRPWYREKIERDARRAAWYGRNIKFY